MFGAAALVAVLYFGREFFLPLVFAGLISFLLAPVIRRLESWHLGRIGSVVLTTFLSFALIAGLAYMVTGQLIDLANQLPKYKDNMRLKLASLRQQKDSPFSKATQTLKEITEEATEDRPAEVTPDPVVKSRAGNAAEESSPPAEEQKKPQPAVPVEVVPHADNAFEMLRGFIAPILGPVGNSAVIIVFVVFMLIGREDLRDRIIHLVGRGRLHVTTQALDDAAQRVSRYLLAQFIVNASYGIPIGVGLYLIGIPNAALWGLMAAILRFIPYIGPWMAAAFPILLSLAVSADWTAPVLTVGLFVIMELISNNVIEPWLYGASTGLSPMAVIVSAVFWTWLWGALGLILATPLTVCLAVLGKYIPSLAFLDVLLGDTPPIATGDRLYQRLLAQDEEEAIDIVEAHVKKFSLAAAYDDVILMALRQADADCRSGVLQDEARKELYQIVRRILVELDETPPPPSGSQVPVLCLPASSEADELIAVMLAHLLEHRGIQASVGSSKALASEMVEQATSSGATIFCISAMPPASIMPATYLAKRLRVQMPQAHVIIGIWHATETDERRQLRLKRAQADDVFLTLEKASTEIALLAGLKQEPAVAPAVEVPTPEPAAAG